MRTVALVQARMGSTRLPGKSMADLGGRPLLAMVLERVAATPGLADLALACPDQPEDDPIAAVGDAMDVRVVRGSTHDVLDRYHQAAAATRADVILRVTADCPLVDPAVLGDLIVLRAEREATYSAVMTGAVPPAPDRRRYPDGLDAEAFPRETLEIAWREARAPDEREHVMPFASQRPERFPPAWLQAPLEMGAERWTVDFAEDLAFVRAVVARLPPRFGWRDIRAVLDAEPELRALNAAVTGS